MTSKSQQIIVATDSNTDDNCAKVWHQKRKCVKSLEQVWLAIGNVENQLINTN